MDPPVRAGRGRRRGHRPPRPQLDLRLAALRRARRARRRLLASLADQVEHVRGNLAPARNHRTLELYALFIAGARVPRARDLLDLAVAELDRNLATDFRPDGVHREASTHYHAIALRSFVGARENARRYGIELPPGFDERLARAPRLPGALHAPGRDDPRALRRRHGRLLRGCSATRVRRERNVSFPDGGYYVQRSGWDARARAS